MNWEQAFATMRQLAAEKSSNAKQPVWKYGQQHTLNWVAGQLEAQARKGIVVADEVGMGKTRVVMAAILAVLKAKGTVAAIVPPGLLYQWKKEWDDFIKSLDTGGGKDYSPILIRSYNTLFENTKLNFPFSTNEGKWLLLSHQFGPPQITQNSQSWRYGLPIFVRAQQEYDNNKRRNRHWQWAQKTYGSKCPTLNEPISKCSDKGWCEECSTVKVLKKASEFLRSEGRWHLLRNTPDIQLGYAQTEFKDWFQGEDGLRILSELLGPVDLVVIDEAHKSPNEDSVLETALTKILKPAAKYIAMTATPMALSPAQWEGIFSRIGEAKNYPGKAIRDFDEAHRAANKHSKDSIKVEDLIAKSLMFTEALRPYVTRRLRIRQEETSRLLGINKDECSSSAHPHRDYSKPIIIDFTGIEDNWRKPVLALEAIGKTAKGCKTHSSALNRALGRLKISDSRYAAGQLADKSDEPIADEDNLDQLINEYISKDSLEENCEQERHVRGKLRRIQYWRKIIEKNNDLSGHPRIQRTADNIESIIWGQKGKVRDEKVLVFGTFKTPLHALRNVLSHRAVLRLLERKEQSAAQEPALPASDSCLNPATFKQIWKEYKRIKGTNPTALQRTYTTEEELKQAIQRGGKTYESIRKRLFTHINDKFAKELPGDAAINHLDVAELLRARLVNEFICRGEATNQLSPSVLRNKALQIWKDYLESYFEKQDKDTDELKASSDWAAPDWFTGSESDIRKLDSLADNAQKEDLQKMVTEEIETISTRLGFFARTLDGDVKMDTTRRVLQAQFNDGDSFPRVLIAQSQVGREGLNLHKACRTVVQFHSEWNPGVIEQQIGRVDRIDSFWEKKVNNAREENSEIKVSDAGFPKIDIHAVIFHGTYDHFQYKVSKHRRDTLKAHLFGELLHEEALSDLPESDSWKELLERLKRAAPDFSPPEMT